MRRRIAYTVLALIPLALAACSDVSAPRRDGPTDDPTCKSGYTTGSGEFICTER